MMSKTSKEDALEYMVECVLATIEHMATLKSKSQYELRRQVNIAIKGVAWLIAFNITPTFGRVVEVFRGFDGDVSAWVKSIDIKDKL